LLDRDSLWRLLVVMTARKASHLKRDETRQKRGGGAAPVTDSDRDDDSTLEQILSTEPSPELAAELAEEYRRLLQNLGDPELEAVAVARMEGYGVDEIAAKLNFAPRSIKRKLQLIRSIWEKEKSA
jgi:DNA-directed RNA polymerase specialized sigma24 family protein